MATTGDVNSTQMQITCRLHECWIIIGVSHLSLSLSLHRHPEGSDHMQHDELRRTHTHTSMYIYKHLYTVYAQVITGYMMLDAYMAFPLV